MEALAAAQAELTRLRAELAEARKDAQRYRWLKENEKFPGAIDAVIDAAMSQEGKS